MKKVRLIIKILKKNMGKEARLILKGESDNQIVMLEQTEDESYTFKDDKS